MRDAEAVRDLFAAYDARGEMILLPWTIFFELTKHPNPDTATSTVVASLKLLAQRPEVVRLARPVLVLVDAERKFGCCEVITEVRHGRNLRAVFDGIRAGDVREIRRAMPTLQSWIRDVLNAVRLPDTLRTLVAAVDKDIRAVELKGAAAALRAGNRLPFRAVLRGMMESGVHERALGAVGFPMRRAQRVANSRTAATMHVLAHLQSALLWRVRGAGGLSSKTEESIEHGVADHEVAVLGSLTEGIISGDGELRDRYGDIVAVAAEIW